VKPEVKPDIKYFDALPSTNDKAMELLLLGCGEGTVVAARSQLAGRGQQHAGWESEAGKNLTFSMALYPAFLHAEQMFYLSKAVSLGVADFLRKQKIDATIKWPNDVYVGERKICGILIEQSISGEYVAQSVAGVGLNVNQTTFHRAPNATSMLLCDGVERDLKRCLEEVAACILTRYSRLKQRRHPAPDVDREYLSLLYRREGFFAYRCGGERFVARIADVAPSGELVLQEASGRLRRFWFKEVEFIH